MRAHTHRHTHTHTEVPWRRVSSAFVAVLCVVVCFGGTDGYRLRDAMDEGNTTGHCVCADGLQLCKGGDVNCVGEQDSKDCTNQCTDLCDPLAYSTYICDIDRAACS
eukprot:TRINITY_DN11162_c0_g1_i1.p1 TRINITY_DN11162_c0_g1~~TRINITY_DN11162_c0_g1_i1.p1  ORF type:complete len:107 (-),score=0.06 TRINITY_DN11162_c0_g1_i1:142-462(-)